MPEGIPEGMDFFEWLFQLGIGLEGDPNYYSSGEATEAEYNNLFTIATSEVNKLEIGNPVRSQYYQFLEETGAIEGDPEYYSRGEASLAEFSNLIGTAASSFGGGEASTASPEAVGVLAGGQTVRVMAGEQERWYQVYEWPRGSGQYISFQYNSREQAEKALGDAFEYTNRSDTWYNEKVLAEAEAEQLVGTSGSFYGLMDEIMRDAAAASGVRDPSLVGRIAGNDEMQRIMAQAIAGEWTQEQILAEQRRTDFWQNELYPGISAFYGRTSDPEGAWARYANNVSPELTALGYARGPDGTYKDLIGEMLNNGIDAQTFLENAPVFAQAVQNRPFFEVLRQRSQAELGKDLEFGDWFNLLKGEAAPDVQRVAEGAVVAFEAQQQGVGVTENMLQRLIAERDLSVAEARNVFQEVSQAVLALGETGLSRGNLTRDDIISAMADINAASGLNPEEVRLRVAKLARENDLFDEEKLSFFTGFTPQGTPIRPGLAALNPEGA